MRYFATCYYFPFLLDAGLVFMIGYLYNPNYLFFVNPQKNALSLFESIDDSIFLIFPIIQFEKIKKHHIVNEISLLFIVTVKIVLPEQENIPFYYSIRDYLQQSSIKIISLQPTTVAQYLMLFANKNTKVQLTARTARLQSKIQVISRKYQNFNQLYLKFPQPQTTTNAQKLRISSFRAARNKGGTEQHCDSRRNVIKEKIKLRIKQQLCTALKREQDKDSANQSANQFIQFLNKSQITSNSSFSQAKGLSFIRYNRDNSYFNKNRSIYKTACGNIATETAKVQRYKTNQKDFNRFNRARVWSSVDIKESDRRVVKRQNKNSFHRQKIEAFSIQPWKSSEEAQSQFE